jgi:hypothetical protein
MDLMCKLEQQKELTGMALTQMHMQKIAMSKIINQKQQNYRKNKRQSW